VYINMQYHRIVFAYFVNATNCLLVDWMHLRRWSGRTWLHTIELDLQPQSLGLNSVWQHTAYIGPIKLMPSHEHGYALQRWCRWCVLRNQLLKKRKKFICQKDNQTFMWQSLLATNVMFYYDIKQEMSMGYLHGQWLEFVTDKRL